MTFLKRGCFFFEEAKEHCGVAAISINTEHATGAIYNSLLALQHRGQDSAGIAMLIDRDGTQSKLEGIGSSGEENMHEIRIKLVKGLVSNFRESWLGDMKSRVGVGHVRYCTAGSPGLDDAQPVLINCDNLRIALAFNGNVANVKELRKILEADHDFIGDGDGEILAALFAVQMKKEKSIEKAFTAIHEKVDGAYSIAVVTSDGDLAAYRDQYGIRPLSIGISDEGVMFASESVALRVNGFDAVRSLKPGELVIVKDGSVESRQIASLPSASHCMFEYVYFSRPDSILDGVPVSDVRYRLGMALARRNVADVDVIVPVPDTSRSAAEGIGAVTGIPVREGLIKNRYIGRTFIMPTQEQRERAVRIKLNPVASVLDGKRVLLVDDSLVRGTTLRNIVAEVRSAGAKSVDVWITCPPIISPCFYGVDMSNHKQLAAANMGVEEIRRSIGADHLVYQRIEELKEAIGLGENICAGCLTGKYPTPLAQRLSEKSKSMPLVGRYTEL